LTVYPFQLPVIKAHGSSNDQSIFSAIRQTREMVAKEVIPTISSVMEKEPLQ
ncbi:phosphate acyltransferase PlsX, partial [Bacillus sp. B-TM1]